MCACLSVCLLRTLQELGVSGSALSLLTSYLKDRTYRVTWRGSVSDPCQLTTGVPQGSVLGPLLFSLYTNSLGSDRSYRAAVTQWIECWTSNQGIASSSPTACRCVPEDTSPQMAPVGIVHSTEYVSRFGYKRLTCDMSCDVINHFEI